MRVRALQEVYYAGRDRHVGEIFETEDDMHARVLQIAGRVEAVTEDVQSERRGPRYRRRDIRAEE